MTHWTSQAWTNSHEDYFTRNILTFPECSDASISDLEARNLHRSNAVQKPWPTAADLVQWRQSAGYGADTSNATALQVALDAAIDEIAEACGLYVRPVDADGNVDATADAVTIPPKVHLAVILHAAWLYELRQMPTGVVGSDGAGGAIRTGFAPGVDRLLFNHRKVGLA